MIAEGRRKRAVAAVERLRTVLGHAGVCLPELRVEPCVWDVPEIDGPVRVVELGQVLPEVVDRLADLLETGLRAEREPLRRRLREVNERTAKRGELWLQ
ncbi:hypothetical protein JGS22_009890 [Streptomyces sp. P38-E01]|uniref:Uncharacterized protein n=1 Tax=Streptomyces tardus TaxID=2780544 RepID=A0A949N4H3_9ACTN|nr:hypothetical protein [Streptomyces tardus]MBU7597919.1 hypothetical protein [Streptomyces tardus]